MQPSSDQIKQALLTLAHNRSRPEFELFLVRQVIFSIKNNKPHALKEEVLNIISGKEKQKKYLATSNDREDKRLNDLIRKHLQNGFEINKNMYIQKLKSVCSNAYYVQCLSKQTQLTKNLINRVIEGKIQLTIAMWETIQPELYKIETQQRKK